MREVLQVIKPNLFLMQAAVVKMRRGHRRAAVSVRVLANRATWQMTKSLT